MATLHLLGTGAALSDPHRTVTMLALSHEGDTLLVDCGGDVVQRLLLAGRPIKSISGLILTHEHPDHVGGFPLFMEKVWLAGRRAPIPVYGIAPALDQARRIFEAFDTSGWDGMPEIRWQEVAHEEDAAVLESDLWRVTAAPVDHSVPTVGLRVESRSTGRAVAYSCDTGPSEAVVRLARGTDVLVHEATGSGPGHSSAEEAAQAAAQAAVHRLLLVHLPPGLTPDHLADARQWFTDVELGEEGGAYAW